MKKLLSIILAIGIIATFSLSAFAATLTVEGNDLTGKTVTAVRMFDATWVDKDTQGNVAGQIDADEQVGYTLCPEWLAFFRTESGQDAMTGEEAYEYVAEMDDAELLTLALHAKEYYNANTATFASLKSTSPAATNNQAVLTNLDAGYYLVIPASGSTSTTRHHDAILVNVPSTQSNPKVNLKSEYPTVQKTADGTAATAAQIGDVVEFVLTTTVPDMTEYDAYQFAFKDTMSNGLTFVNDSLTIKVGDKNVKNDAEHGYQFTRNGQNLTVSFADLNDDNTELADDTPVQAGDVITMTYQAKINAQAVIGGTGNANTAYVEYSNDPADATGATKGESLRATASVYTYAIEIHKYHDSDVVANRLAGAIFELYKGSDATPVQLVATGTADVYRIATAEEIDDTSVTKVTTVTTPASGIVTIQGLDTGVYHLKETQAPSGYNKLGSPIDITVSVTNNNYSAPSYTVGTAAASNSNVIGVENNDGSLLPMTGGTGTIIIIAVGAGLVVGAVYVLFFMKKDEDAPAEEETKEDAEEKSEEK